MKKLDKLREQYEKLGKEIEALESKKIDYSKLPKGILVETGTGKKRYFSHYKDGRYYCFNDGATKETVTGYSSWGEIRVIENPPQPWFGGECPIPDGVRFNIWLRGSIAGEPRIRDSEASDYIWWWDGEQGDIIAYQILGE